MNKRLHDYEPIVGPAVIDELGVLASHLRGLRVQNINSTAVGGGVAEILHRMVPLLRELGLQATWNVMTGGEAFFRATKTFHNALHGVPGPLTPEMKGAYLDTTAENIDDIPVTGDVVFVHDPQPAGLVQARGRHSRRWVWRCHIDLSAPNPEFWNFLQPYIEQYDASVFSAPFFAQKLRIPQFFIPPSIDPLSDKNRDLPREQINAVLERHHLDPRRPIITQVSRFDRLKDPLGVIEAYRLVRKNLDCQLVLAGSGAEDDPEGVDVLAEVRKKAGKDPDIHILPLPPDAHIEINALQRGSTVVVQKSLREGFGLTVAEALWKGRPVVAGAVGGITLQVLHGVTGLLVASPEGAAQAVKQLLANPDFARRLGENGREHVRQNFLLTRHLKDYLCVFLAVHRLSENIVCL